MRRGERHGRVLCFRIWNNRSPLMMIREIQMSVQVVGRRVGSRKRRSHAVTVLAVWIRSIDRYIRLFFAQALTTLEDNRHREGARLIHRYRHLMDEPLDKLCDPSASPPRTDFTSSHPPIG
jgi:hypothetical protein